MIERIILQDFLIKKETIICDSQTLQLQICIPSDQIRYAFYGREFVFSDENCNFACQYGYMYPVSAITLVNRQRGMTFIAQTPVFDAIRLKKEDQVEITFSYRKHPGEKISVLAIPHGADFREGIQAYKKWYASQNEVSGSTFLENCFHLKRYFFHEQLCPKAALKRDGSVCLNELLDEDTEAFGGIDVGLLFDGAFDTKSSIRCGNDKPFLLNSMQIEALKKQMKRSQIPYFTYFDPYLIDEGSTWDQELKKSAPICVQGGEIFRNWGERHWHPCLNDSQYQKMAKAYLKESIALIDTDGIYLDEFGNGRQYQCCSQAHNHPIPLDQNMAERKFVLNLKKEIPKKYWMCEFAPADNVNHLYDIVLSDTRTLVNIYRFIFPQIKFIRIIGCDLPLGNNVFEVNKSFFNGEGIWLDNDANNPIWYPNEIKDVLKRQYRILKRYGKIIDSGNAVPLYPVKAKQILCNLFYKDDIYLFFLLNPSDKADVAFLPEWICRAQLLYGDIQDCKVITDNDIEIHIPPHQITVIRGFRKGENNV